MRKYITMVQDAEFRGFGPCVPPPKGGTPNRAFTLIELLVVITIIGILAAMTLVGLNGVSKQKKISSATAELHTLTLAIEAYKSKYGVYPPGNPTNTFTAALYNPLYYELTGVSFTDSTHKTYKTVDATEPAANVTSVFGVGGILNCTKGSGEDAVNAENFLPGLRPNQVGTVWGSGVSAQMLATSVAGPDLAYFPIGTQGVNVFRYKQPDPTNNNPGSYDLWVNLSIGQTNFPSGSGPPYPFTPSKLYLICNWAKNYQGGSTMP